MFPELFSLFGRPVHSFGIFAALGFLAGYGLTFRALKRGGLAAGLLPDLAFVILAGGLAAARLSFVLMHPAEWAADPLLILRVREGGLIQAGGILGGLAAGLWFCRRAKISFLQYSDPVSIGLCGGLAVSRIGCFLAGCCHGRAASAAWGVIFEHPHALAPRGIYLYPTQLYEAALGLGICLVLMRWKPRAAGQIFFLYLLLTSAARAVIQPLRSGSDSGAMALTALLAAAGIFGYVRLQMQFNALRTHKKR